MSYKNLPKEWKLLRIAALINRFDAGISVNGADREASRGEYGVLKVSAVTEGYFRPQENKVIFGLEKSRAHLNPKANRLIMSRANTPDLVGAIAYIDRDYPGLFLPDKLWQLEPYNEQLCSIRWLGYLLSSTTYKKILRNMATGSSQSMKNITKDSVMQLEIPVPPMDEQERIAKVLLTWDIAIEKTKRLIAAKKRLRRAYGSQLFSGKNSSSIKLLRADQLFAPISEKGRADLEVLSATQDRGIIPRHMLDKQILMESSNPSNFKVVREGDFIISLRSFQGGLEYSPYEGVISPAYTVLRSLKNVLPTYFRHYLKSHDFLQRLSVAVIGIRDGKQISFADFASIKLPIPTKEEQSSYAKLFDVIDEEIKVLKKQLTLYKAQKRGLMQKLLTGEWQVPIAEKVAKQ